MLWERIAVVCCGSVRDVERDSLCLLLLFYIGAHHFDSTDDKLVPSSNEMVVEIVDRSLGGWGTCLETQIA